MFPSFFAIHSGGWFILLVVSVGVPQMLLILEIYSHFMGCKTPFGITQEMLKFCPPHFQSPSAARFVLICPSHWHGLHRWFLLLPNSDPSWPHCCTLYWDSWCSLLEFSVVVSVHESFHCFLPNKKTDQMSIWTLSMDRKAGECCS